MVANHGNADRCSVRRERDRSATGRHLHALLFPKQRVEHRGGVGRSFVCPRRHVGEQVNVSAPHRSRVRLCIASYARLYVWLERETEDYSGIHLFYSEKILGLRQPGESNETQKDISQQR